MNSRFGSVISGTRNYDVPKITIPNGSTFWTIPFALNWYSEPTVGHFKES